MTDIRDQAFELAPWNEHGRAKLIAWGPSGSLALAEALRGVLVAMGGQLGTDGTGRSASLRAEARDVSALLPGLLASLLDRIESLDTAVSSVTIEGLVRSDDGYVAWGTAHLATPPAGPLIVVEFDGVPAVFDSQGSVRIEIELLRGERVLR